MVEKASHDSDPNYSDVAAFTSEGGRVGIITCKRCGVALLLDIRDQFSPTALHDEFHEHLTHLHRLLDEEL